MVLHHRQENHAAFANKFSAPRLGNEVNALRRSPRENDFVSVRCADVSCNALACLFVSLRRARTQGVQSPMNIGVLVFVKILKRLDHWSRLLRSRSAVEINQRMPVRLFVKNWEIFTDRVPIDRGRSNLVHTTICYTWRRAPIYSPLQPWRYVAVLGQTR